MNRPTNVCPLPTLHQSFELNAINNWDFITEQVCYKSQGCAVAIYVLQNLLFTSHFDVTFNVNFFPYPNGIELIFASIFCYYWNYSYFVLSMRRFINVFGIGCSIVTMNIKQASNKTLLQLELMWFIRNIIKTLN